jgi:signal transduction histidine kinase
MKRVLDSIGNLTQFSRDGFSDREPGKLLYQRITRDISKTDLLLNGLLNYFQITTAIKKMDTVNALIEEVLKKNEAQLEEKGVQLSKKLEKNLPETIVPDDQLKYILNSVLQYVIMLTPPNGNIQFLTESFFFQREIEEAQPFFEKYGGYIEISVIFGGGREPMEEGAAALGRILTQEKDKALELMLRLVKGIVLRNWGRMNSETDEKGAKKVISLRFPLERRRAVFYPPTQRTAPVCVTSV